ncbi:MAG: SwmB domain-containing protein, partial [bacterium]|nr:SwmB domain-containing protein [bacterium]
RTGIRRTCRRAGLLRTGLILLLAAAAGLLAAPAQDARAQTTSDLPWTTEMTVGASGGTRGYAESAFGGYGSLDDYTFTHGGTEYTIRILRITGGTVTLRVSHNLGHDSGLVLEWAGETLPLNDATDTGTFGDNRYYNFNNAWLTANASSLDNDNYQTTLTTGATKDVCIRTAAQSCTPDTAAPTLDSAEVTGTALVLTFDEDLAAAANLANSAFAVKKTPAGGSEQAVSLTGTPAISGKTVTLTLASAAAADDTGFKVSYTKPATGTDNKLKDAADNEVASFTDESVTNATSGGAPGIAGATDVGAVLTATLGDIADADGLPATTFPDGYSFQWVRVDGGTPTDISGATDPTYTLAAADEGKTVRVKVSFPDGASNAETRESAETAAIGPRPTVTATLISVTEDGTETERFNEDSHAWFDLTIVVSKRPDDRVTFRASLEEDTATVVDDYGALRPRYEEVPPERFEDLGDGTWRYYRRYRVTLNKDTVADPDETLSLFLSGPSVFGFPHYRTIYTGGVRRAGITIIDDGRPEIAGTARSGETLTAGLGDIADAHDLPSTAFPTGYTFQWIRVDGGVETEISSATDRKKTFTY